MRKRLISLMIVAGIAMSGYGTTALAATGSQSVKKPAYKKAAVKKRTAVKKKQVHAVYRKGHRAIASVEDPSRLVVQSSAVVVMDETGNVCLR